MFEFVVKLNVLGDDFKRIVNYYINSVLLMFLPRIESIISHVIIHDNLTCRLL